ncbi:MAG: hypothetical protein WA821_06110 [Anaerolineales bacterium]
MNKQNENQFVYKDSNAMRWAGLLFLFVGLLFYFIFGFVFGFGNDPFFSSSGWTGVFEKLIPWLFVAISLAMVLFSANLTITADKSTRVLQLRYGYLLFHRTANIPFDDIADIQSQAGVNERRAETRGYRLVAVLKNGTVVPFRSYFTRHDNKKQAAVDMRFAVTGSRHSDVPPVKSAGASLTI